MNESGGGGNRWRSPRGSPGGWQSPRFRGNNSFSPRYQNQGGGHWQQRSPSPYQRHGPHNPPPFITSTPIHHQNYRQNFRGRGGHRPPRSFGHSHSDGPQGIEAWVSPQMWEDPWKQFESEFSNTDFSLSTTKFANLDSSDFNANENPLDSSKSEIDSEIIDSSTSELNNPEQESQLQDQDPKDSDSSDMTAKDLLNLITS